MFLEKHPLPAYAEATSGTATDATDPYQYQSGFGNHHCSEAIAGALPRGGTNIPQRCPHGLYPEHLNGTPFISSREAASNVLVNRLMSLSLSLSCQAHFPVTLFLTCRRSVQLDVPDTSGSRPRATSPSGCAQTGAYGLEGRN